MDVEADLPAAESSRPRRSLTWQGLVESAGALAMLGTVAGLFGRFGWAFELASHFKVQCAIVLAVTGAFAVVGRRWRTASVLWVGVLINAGLVALAIAPKAQPAQAGEGLIRLLSVNVHTSNTRSDLVLEAIRRADPDVVLLLEVDDRWMADLVPIGSQFTNVVAEPRPDNFGIALLSRLPIRDHEILELGEVSVPSISAVIEGSGRIIHLLGTHLIPPSSPETASERNQQLAAVAEWARATPNPSVVLGDLNATPWSPYFIDLIRNSGLIDARTDWAFFNSWPARLFPMHLPLDHCLISPEIAVFGRRVESAVGSDHYPLLVELVFPSK